MTSPEPNKFSATLAAGGLWHKYGLKTPADLVLEDLAFAQGVVVMEGRLDSADARLIRKGSKGLVRIKEDIPEVGRKRFAIAHELGHWLLHKAISQIVFCTSEDMIARYKGSVPEIEANYFAAELLMPERLYREKMGGADPSTTLLRDLTDYFQTSLTATAVRMVEVADDSRAIVVTKNGVIQWWRASERFDGFWIDAKTEASPNTVAGAYFRGQRMTPTAEKVNGEEWLGERASHVAEELYELAIPMDRYGQVLSLLWPT